MLSRFLAHSSVRRAPLRKKLWIGAAGVALFVGILLVFCIIASAREGKRKSVGLDFIAFYTAGTFVHRGMTAGAGGMYDIAACQRFQHTLAASFGVDLGSAVGPWWNPPIYAWVFVPLARLPYETALAAWLAIDVVCAALACWLMVRMLPRAGSRGGWKNWLLVPVLVGLSMPFLQCMTHAQNSCTSLLILAGAVAAWRGRRGIAAGAMLGLLFYKPQLAAVLAIVLIVDLGWPALAGLGMTGAALLAINVITLPGSLTDYLHRLPANVRFVQTQVPYMWDRHVTIKAFWRLLFQGRTAGPAYAIVTVLTVICCVALGGYLMKGLWGYWRASRPREVALRSGGLMVEEGGRRDRLIAAAIAATPLLMPFYFDYDQLLLAIPAVLLAGEWLRRPAGAPVSRVDRLLLIVWPIYYCVLILNPDIGEAIHINLAVPLLTTIATLNIARLNWPSETRGAEVWTVEMRRRALAA